MSRPKGINKTGGRAKGTPNKTSQEMRDKIQDVLMDNWGKVNKDMQKLKPKERLDFMVKLLPYITPKLNNTDFKFDFSALTEEQLDTIIERLTDGQE